MARAKFEPGDMLRTKLMPVPHVLLVEQVRETTCIGGTQTEYYGCICIENETFETKSNKSYVYWKPQYFNELLIEGPAEWPPSIYLSTKKEQ